MEEEYIIDEEYGNEERHFYADKKMPCPRCSLMTLEEQTMGYEQVIYCTHCEYSESKTI